MGAIDAGRRMGRRFPKAAPGVLAVAAFAWAVIAFPVHAAEELGELLVDLGKWVLSLLVPIVVIAQGAFVALFKAPPPIFH